MHKTLTAIIGSKNPVKIAAAKQALSTLYPEKEIHCQGIDAPSEVADQPMTEAETKTGAVNRTKYCQSQHPDADIYLAMEGGVDLFDFGPATFAYIAIATHGQVSIGRSASLPLPMPVYQALTQGAELGDVMDSLFNTENVKQKGGAIGLLTQGHATRTSIYTQAIILAMAPILNPNLFSPN